VGKFATHFAESDGLKIAYSDVGAGLAIAFLHGIGSTRDVWDEQLTALSPRYRCIAVEYRGYGESEIPPRRSLLPDASDRQAITRNAYARDAFAVLAACGIERAHVCGLSLGGVVALECYAHDARRVLSLALADTFAYYPRGLETIGQRVRGIVELGIERFAASRAAGVLAPHAPWRKVDRVRKQMASIRLDVYQASTRATWTGDYRPLLPKIDVPVLVLWGEHDHAIAPRKLSEEIASAVPDCRGLVIIQNAGHVSNFDNPEKFNEALARFVASVT
jgi:3-oxoadipate enol-lactonase